MVRIRLCCSPLSPMALRAALMRLVSVEFRHDAALPDGGDEVVLADHALAMLDQVDQEIEHLRLERNQIAAAPEFAPVRVEGISLKEICQISSPPGRAGAGRTSSQPIIKTI